MMNGLQTLPQWRKFFGQPQGALLGALNSVYPAGKFFALFLVTYVCDRYGRKTTMAIGALTCVAFAVMQAVSQNLSTFIAARCVLGFFTSFLAQPSPIIISELAYPTHRGKLTALYNTSFVSRTSQDEDESRTNAEDASIWVELLLLGALSEHSSSARTGAGESPRSSKEHSPRCSC
jgi:hypothetical protein